ncbi:MAG: hypothetical protein A3J83_03860 [Elusimicrobia bacterium RIFOXYA2_FULL_40_6]|nr:MAG: hypothetical protein A3J83_03860 [Elusimicrobia bacterium RIFOXYA2_FULL_40_6]
MNNKYLNLLSEMSVSEFKLKDQSTILGFFWTLLNPLLMFTVLYLLFTKWMGKFVENYPLYLIIGIIQWSFFASATSYALSSLVRRSDLVKNLKFPYEIIIFSSIFSILISHLLEFAVLLVFLVAIGVKITLNIFFLPLIIITALSFAVSISLPLAMLFVYYRDIERIWNILTMAGFFLTPIFYTLSVISPERQFLLLFNPMTHIINATRSCLIYNKMPDLVNLLIIFMASLFLIAITIKIFKKNEQNFAEIL